MPPQIIVIRSALHRENLVAKRLLEEVMHLVDQVVSHIRGTPTCSRIFQQLCVVNHVLITFPTT